MTFDGAKETTFQWEERNDAVMGGSSSGTFRIGNGSAIFEGECLTVPTPSSAPGWISFQTVLSNFSQVNSCQGLVIRARSSTDYAGFRLSFGTDRYFSRQGYKATFRAPVARDFGAVNISFYDFTRAWDDATGEAAIKCEHETGVCPTFLTLNNIQRVQLWAEGVVGKVHLEIQSISAYDCTTHGNSMLTV